MALEVNEDMLYIEIPKGYTLENKLISFLINNFFITALHNGEENLIFNKDKKESLRIKIAEMIVKNLRVPLFDIELEIDENKVSGTIKHSEGKPLAFEFLNKKINEN